MKILLLFLGLGAVTFLMRLSFIGLLGKRDLPERFRTALHFVPLAVFTAIIVPEVLMPGGQLTFAVSGEPRITAAIAAVIVAAFTRRVLPTIAAGMGVLWLLRWLMM
ncbi:AzlD domain-containing protein [Termitidicoccus mucosus]|uniref:Uncharacterized protein n=1 Tax=Termitidicoccus mucosus TaxID=1184151 RepID=A0A178IN07_9BACT|nr:hypothetical protein AW736_03895 [Opitutaceae bacterium TSB47]